METRRTVMKTRPPTLYEQIRIKETHVDKKDVVLVNGSYYRSVDGQPDGEPLASYHHAMLYGWCVATGQRWVGTASSEAQAQRWAKELAEAQFRASSS